MAATPWAWASAALRSVTGSPSTSIVPSSGAWMPVMILIRVDLPAPFSPTSAWTSPGASARDTPSSAWVAPKRFAMPRMASTASPPDSTTRTPYGVDVEMLIYVLSNNNSHHREAQRAAPRGQRLHLPHDLMRGCAASVYGIP